MDQEFISMEVVSSQVAGIELDSPSQGVAEGQSEQYVREFGVFNQDLFDMTEWLKDKGVKTIGLESH